jgi:hypothetical protein
MRKPKADWLVVVVGAVVGVALALILPVLLDLRNPVEVVIGHGTTIGASAYVEVLGIWHFRWSAPREEDLWLWPGILAPLISAAPLVFSAVAGGWICAMISRRMRRHRQAG